MNQSVLLLINLHLRRYANVTEISGLMTLSHQPDLGTIVRAADRGVLVRQIFSDLKICKNNGCLYLY